MERAGRRGPRHRRRLHRRPALPDRGRRADGTRSGRYARADRCRPEVRAASPGGLHGRQPPAELRPRPHSGPAHHADPVGPTDRLGPRELALVLLATSLPVGSIYFGSDLVAKVLHHSPESADSAEAAPAQSVSPQADESAGEQASNQTARSTSDQAELAPTQPTESTPEKVAEAPATGPTEAAASSPLTRCPNDPVAHREGVDRSRPSSADRSGPRRRQVDHRPRPHRHRSPQRGTTPDRRLERRPADRRAVAQRSTDRPEPRPRPARPASG